MTLVQEATVGCFATTPLRCPLRLASEAFGGAGNRPLLAFGRIPHKGLGFLARLAEGEGRGAYGTRNKPANTHSERHDWTL